MSLPFAPAPVRTMGPFGAESGHKEGTKFGAMRGRVAARIGGPLVAGSQGHSPRVSRSTGRPSCSTPPGRRSAHVAGQGHVGARGDGRAGRFSLAVPPSGPVAAGWSQSDLLMLIAEVAVRSTRTMRHTLRCDRRASPLGLHLRRQSAARSLVSVWLALSFAFRSASVNNHSAGSLLLETSAFPSVSSVSRSLSAYASAGRRTQSELKRKSHSPRNNSDNTAAHVVASLRLPLAR